ncbi:MAG: glucose-1-phosphate thymidylyltransferase [Deltaproteobacteria bacterium]|nr:glucose-1-phosphate thymidylyltransferase [Deltaproteobacteria bacterium]
MSPELPLKLFTQTELLYLTELFPENAFQLLGAELKIWLEKVMLQIESEYGDPDPALRDRGVYIEGKVAIAKSAKIESGAFIRGPAVIGPGSEVRHGAYIRGNVFVGKDCVVGHTTEVKNSCLLDGAKAGHFAYIGDSVLCRETNLGAGTKIANLKLNRDPVRFRDPRSGHIVNSGLKKFGAIIGDRAQTGCNSVLSPGSLLLADTGVFPCSHFHGTLQTGIFRN